MGRRGIVLKGRGGFVLKGRRVIVLKGRCGFVLKSRRGLYYRVDMVLFDQAKVKSTPSVRPKTGVRQNWRLKNIIIILPISLHLQLGS